MLVSVHATAAIGLSARERLLLASLERELSTGWCELLRSSLGCMDSVRASGSDAAREWLASIEATVDEMELIERQFGKGSLLVLEHPDVTEFLGRRTMAGDPFISEGQMEAARRFRAGFPTAA